MLVQVPVPFPPDLILYVNLIAKEALKFFKAWPLAYSLDIPYFADSYGFTVHNFWGKHPEPRWSWFSCIILSLLKFSLHKLYP